MRLATYARGSEERAGLVIGETIYDVQACSSYFGMPPLPSQVLGILESGEFQALRDLGAKFAGGGLAGPDLPLSCWAAMSEVRLMAPIPRPPKIICMGLNYRDHAEEQGARLPDVPLIFGKASSAVIGPGQPIVIPKGSEKTDYEGELAFVVGKRMKRVAAERASEGIFGYCVLNDVTEREIQRERVYYRSKSIDTFAPMGPWIVTSDEVGDASNLKITTKVNGEVRQSSSTSNLVFTPPQIIAFVTRYITLEPGDVIATGTPGGVGVFRKPPVFLKQGDTVEITIEGIGTLTNPVTAEA